MSLGTENLLKTLNGIRELGLDLIALSKEGIKLGNIGRVLEVIGDVRVLMEVGPKALPELQDIDGAEAPVVLGAAYGCLKDLYEAAVKK